MRLIPLLLLSFALVLAGCAKDEGGATTSTPPTGTTTTKPTTTTGTTTTTTTTTPTNTTTTPTTPTKPAPQDLPVAGDWSASTPPGSAPAAKKITIPAGYSMGALNLTFNCAATVPACVASGVTVKVAGITCTLADGPVTGPTPCKDKTGAVTPGEANVEFSGTGLVMVTGALTVT